MVKVKRNRVYGLALEVMDYKLRWCMQNIQKTKLCNAPYTVVDSKMDTYHISWHKYSKRWQWRDAACRSKHIFGMCFLLLETQFKCRCETLFQIRKCWMECRLWNGTAYYNAGTTGLSPYDTNRGPMPKGLESWLKFLSTILNRHSTNGWYVQIVPMMVRYVIYVLSARFLVAMDLDGMNITFI